MASHSFSTMISLYAKSSKTEIDSVIRGLKEAGNEITSIQQKINKAGKTNYTLQYTDGLKKVTETFDESGKSIKSTSTLIKQGLDTGKLIFYGNVLRGIVNRFKDISNEAINFNETTEKFNVSMGESILSATKFQNRISEQFGTSRAEMMNYQSNFKNIMAGLGDIASEQAEKVSESLTKMSLDYSSLFNVSQSTASNKIQAALTGQIMPIRRESGYDVSKNAVMQKAKDLGIERTYNTLTETEKRLIRIMLLMEQMKRTGAFEDLARTIESPANQLKVLQNQLQELKIWLGNVFMGTIGAILPYVNAFVMVLKELIKTLAYFVGFTTNNVGLDEVFEVAEESVDGVAGGIGSAAKNAKELKKTLMGFDVLNVIQTPAESQSGGSGGGGSPVGIDPKILNSLKDYESTMESVRMKAADIRDKILDWLGFTKAINPFTGEIVWEYEGIEKTLQKFVKWFSELSLKGKLLVGLGIGAAVSALIGIISKLKATALGKWIGGIVTSGINWVKNMASLIIQAKKTSTGLLSVKTAIASNIKTLGIFAGEIAGVLLAVQGFIGLFKSSREVLEGSNTSMKNLLISVGELYGGLILLGTVVGGPIGALIGALAAIGITIGTLQYQTSEYYKEVAEKNVFGQLKVSTEEWLKILKETSELGIDNIAEKVSASLDRLNTDFIESSSEVEGYGIKFGLMGKKITEEDMPKIEESVSKMCKSTESMIDENTNAQIQLWTDMYKELGNVSEEEQSSMLNKIMEYGGRQKAEIADAQNNITTTYENAIAERGYLSQEEYNFIEEQLNKIRELTQQNMSLSKSDLEYYINDTSNITKDSYVDFEKALTEYQDEENKTISDNYNYRINALNAMYGEEEKSTEEYKNNLKEINDARNKEQKDLDTEIQEYRTKMFGKLIRKYNEVKDNTDENSKAIKSVLEDTFKQSGIDIDNLSEKFGDFAREWKRTEFPKKNLDIYISGLTSRFSGGEGLIGGRASGGPVSVGEMFIAREAGPELVGKIGNTTTVMNNEQIVQAVSQGVASAVSRVMGSQGGSYKLYIDGDELRNVIQQRINRNSNINGE